MRQVLGFCALLLPARALGQDTAELVERFWAAGSPGARAPIAAEILARDVLFDELAALLRRGRTYSPDVERGRILREREGVGGVRHPYMILVPQDYTPERRWPVRLDLHGGMGAKEWRALDGAWSPYWRESHGRITVVPAGWWDSMWWEWSQVENLEAILREVRAEWNVDEDRVVFFGSSDGGAGAFFHAMRSPDRYAGYAAFVAPPDRLTRADFRPDGQMHLTNLASQRFLLGYGETDRKVPLRYIERYMELFAQAGADLNWYVVAGEDHGLRLPAEREAELGRFLNETRRDPLPDVLSWSAERTDRYARRSWLIIDALATTGTDAEPDTANLLPRLGTRLQLRGPTVERVPWGRVELAREGNRVTARTLRVARFRLLLSPDEFDFAEPIVVEVDGRVAFEERLTPSRATLLEWAAVDDDRSQLFAAEIELTP